MCEQWLKSFMKINFSQDHDLDKKCQPKIFWIFYYIKE